MAKESIGNRRDLVHSVQHWARALPDAVALDFHGGTVTFRELNLRANRVANGLQRLGVMKGDRVAIMLPNIPEFVYGLLGTLKLGAVAVPFNTMYKGREMYNILEDSSAKVLIALTNFAPMINEIRPDLPALKHIILTGERNLLFVHPEATAVIQVIAEMEKIGGVDAAYRKMGQVVLETLEGLGVKGAWYKHRGSIRVRGDKIAGFVISDIEGTAVVSGVFFLGRLDAGDFFRVVWVPPEIRDKVLEPLTSVEQETGTRPGWDRVKEILVGALEKDFGVEIKEGPMLRDELFGYEKLRSLAYKVR